MQKTLPPLLQSILQRVHLSHLKDLQTEPAMSKTLFIVILIVVVAMLSVVNVVEAQAGTQYYGNGYNYGYQPSNYLSAYPQQFTYGDGVGADSWERSVVRHILWP